MPSPFPGMDPYLEAPDLWPDVHARLIGEVAAVIQPQVSPGYVARIEQFTFLSDPMEEDQAVRIVPDVRVLGRDDIGDAAAGVAVETAPVTAPVTGIEVTDLVGKLTRQRHLVLRDAQSRELITVIELLSPANKRHGSNGRDAFLDKRHEVTASSASWLEIDLLRRGEPTVQLAQRSRTAYAAFLDRTPEVDKEYRRQYLFPINLRGPLPTLPVPLRAGEADVKLDLQAALASAFDRARYEYDIDYTQPPPEPPLSEEETAWAGEVLKGKGLRE